MREFLSFYRPQLRPIRPMTDEPANHPPRASHRVRRLAVGPWLVFLAAIIASLTFFPVAEYFTWLLEWTDSLGSWGPVLFVVVYMVVCLLFLPGSILTLGAGFLFGVIWGAAVASLGATLGTRLPFSLPAACSADELNTAWRPTRNSAASTAPSAVKGSKSFCLPGFVPCFPTI